MKMRICLSIAVAICLAFMASSFVFAATYYIATNGSDSNPGTEAQPFSSLQKGDGTAVAGDTIIVKAGTYGPGQVDIWNSGASGNPRTWIAQGAVILQGPSTGTTCALGLIGDHNIFDGFEITGGTYATILFFGQHSPTGNEFSNCWIHSGDSGAYTRLIFFAGPAVQNNKVHHCVIGPILGSAIGVNAILNGGIGNKIYNNTIVGASGAGYFGYTESTGELHNNVIDSCGHGIVTDSLATVHSHNVISNIVVEQRYIDTTQGTGEIFDDPQFVNASGNDYHLQSTSPAIDAGMLLGYPFNGLWPDIGAFEATGTPSVMGTVAGRVTDSVTGLGIGGAIVSAGDRGAVTADADGNYSFNLPARELTLQGSSSGYYSSTQTVMVPSGSTLTVDFVLSPMIAKTYYVATDGNDANPGTETQPWATIDKGDRDGILIPGDNIVVKAGTYTLGGVGTDGPILAMSGTAAKPIIYQAQGTVVLDGSSNAGSALRLMGSYLTFDGFRVMGGASACITATGTRGLEIKNCWLSDVASSGFSTGYGLLLQGTLNSRIHHNVIGPYFGMNDEAIEDSATSQGGNKFYNNTLVGTGSAPMWGFVSKGNAAGVEFVNNVVYNMPAGIWGVNLQMVHTHNVISVADLPFFETDQGYAEQLVDPLFVNSSANDYTLQAGSPAIDTGLCLGFAFNGNWPDLGAFEATGAPAAMVTVTGTVTDATTKLPIQGATVKTGPSDNASATTDGSGNYTLKIPAGLHVLNAGALAHSSATASLTVVESSTQTANFELAFAPLHTYYVATGGSDSNPGTDALPWKTLNKADNTMVAGDMVVVKAGTYATHDDGTNRDIWGSGSESAPRMFTTQGAVTLAGSSSAWSAAFRVMGSHNVLDGFHITGGQLLSLWLYSGSTGNLVTNCWISDEIPGVGGEALQVSGSNHIVRNCVIGPNFPDASGIADDSSGAKYYNNVVIGVSDAAISALSTSGTTEFENNIIFNCGAGIRNANAGANLVHSHNIIYGVASGLRYSGTTQGLGEFFSDPLFVNSGTNDYHLQNDSPAIDAGVYVGLPFNNGAPDIGVYEATLVPFETGAIGELLKKGDGAPVILNGAVVTAATGALKDNVIYVEDETRAAGIRVISSPSLPSVAEGQRIRVDGSMTTTSSGERAIQATAIQILSSGSALKPLGSPGKTLVGSGLSNTGILAKTWGKVVRIAGVTSYFCIDDGSGATDGNGNAGIPVLLSTMTTPPGSLPGDGTYVLVVGPVSRDNVGGGAVTVVQPRSSLDIRPAN